MKVSTNIQPPESGLRTTSDSQKVPASGHSSGRAHAGGRRQSERGIALVITLIMLSVTLVMMVAFMALSRREGGSVNTTTDTTVARQASDVALASAQAQIAANFLSGFNGFDSANAYNFGLIVSTNYINPAGFDNTIGANGAPYPTNVNYDYLRGSPNPLSANQLCQNISNLWFLPRAPVFVPTNRPVTGYDFRYYLDLNQNGRFDTNGIGPVFSGIAGEPYYDLNGNPTDNKLVSATFIPPTIASTFNVGDPEWVGILEHPDQPHGPNNHFIARYAFIAVPAGNTLDANYIGNEAFNVAHNVNPGMSPATDGFMRNQGVGSWEINLAAFLADLNTNEWDSFANGLYNYETAPADRNNTGPAFSDATSLLSYRYANSYSSLASAELTLNNNLGAFNNVLNNFQRDGIDDYSDGQVQTTFNTNADWVPDKPTLPWSGSDNPNHFYSLADFFDPSKVNVGTLSPQNSFTNRLGSPGKANDTYDRYTFYRMLDELGTDSSPDDGKLNLNYSNAVVTYKNVNGAFIPVSVGIVAGAETNLVRWTPQNFFIAAADQLLRLYTADWFKADPSNYLANYYGYRPRGYIDATGLGVTNFPNYGVTNQIPTFGITNIPVVVNGSFVYSPAINRLLQLAANLYDASTNDSINFNFNLPHVFRPIFERDIVGNVFIVGYTNLYSGNGPNTVTGAGDPQLALPHPVMDLTGFGIPSAPISTPVNSPIFDSSGLVNVYGVPWIIGAKKGLPNFNRLYMNNIAEVARKLQMFRPPRGGTLPTQTNQMYVFNIMNNIGLSFWNSYATTYPRPVFVSALDRISMCLTNANGTVVWPQTGPKFVSYFFSTNVLSWSGSRWAAAPNTGVPNQYSFIFTNFTYNFLPLSVYRYASGTFDTNTAAPTLWDRTTSPYLQPLPQFGLTTTNYFRGYMLDGNYIIDYVQLQMPTSSRRLTQELVTNYTGDGNMWDPTLQSGGVSWGIVHQIQVSETAQNLPYPNSWVPAPGEFPSGANNIQAAYFKDFMVDPNTKIEETLLQAPYTPARAVYEATDYQANDPLVHYMAPDLTYVDPSTMGLQHTDDLINNPIPTPTLNLIGLRYQPWGKIGQLQKLSLVDMNAFNLAYRDPLVWGADYWDFPTNAYPSVGWIGRVHRGTPWQTVDLKSTNILSFGQNVGKGSVNIGTNTWADWTGDTQFGLLGQYYDAANEAPLEDRLLFDIFTTRFNDNAARGTLPVNVGAGSLDGGLAAWSALFSGMEIISNTVYGSGMKSVYGYTNMVVSPAGADLRNSLVGKIVSSINATRANANLFPYHGFQHAGDVLQTPLLSEYSPFLFTNIPTALTNSINDEMYEWLPQQMMGLVRGSEQRFVVYGYGQTLHPAPNGVVLSGPFFQLVTNYQVTAETAIRAVIRVDNANTARPHVVVESYNVLPP